MLRKEACAGEAFRAVLRRGGLALVEVLALVFVLRRVFIARPEGRAEAVDYYEY